MTDLTILLLAAMLGGAANALAGGGTFLVFPALLLAGVTPIKANATASLALLPGGGSWNLGPVSGCNVGCKYRWFTRR